MTVSEAVGQDLPHRDGLTPPQRLGLARSGHLVTGSKARRRLTKAQGSCVWGLSGGAWDLGCCLEPLPMARLPCPGPVPWCLQQTRRALLCQTSEAAHVPAAWPGVTCEPIHVDSGTDSPSPAQETPTCHRWSAGNVAWDREEPQASVSDLGDEQLWPALGEDRTGPLTGGGERRGGASALGAGSGTCQESCGSRRAPPSPGERRSSCDRDRNTAATLFQNGKSDTQLEPGGATTQVQSPRMLRGSSRCPSQRFLLMCELKERSPSARTCGPRHGRLSYLG